MMGAPRHMATPAEGVAHTSTTNNTYEITVISTKTLMVNRFILNEVSYFGPGARKELPGVVARLGFTKALVVTDKGLMKFGVAKMVLDVLGEAHIPYAVYV